MHRALQDREQHRADLEPFPAPGTSISQPQAEPCQLKREGGVGVKGKGALGSKVPRGGQQSRETARFLQSSAGEQVAFPLRKLRPFPRAGNGPASIKHNW